MEKKVKIGRWGQFVETCALKRVMMLLDVTVMNKKEQKRNLPSRKIVHTLHSIGADAVRMRKERTPLEIEYYL